MIDTQRRNGIFLDGNGRGGRARQLLDLGISRFEKEGTLPDDYGPLYLRQSEAEIALYGEKR